MKSTKKVGICQFEEKKTERDVTEVPKGSESGEVEINPKSWRQSVVLVGYHSETEERKDFFMQ